MENGFAQAGASASSGSSSYGETRGLADAFDTVLGLARRGWNKARANVSPGTAERIDGERLRDAFHAFSDAAARLEGSYAALRGQVEELSARLAQANGELERQLADKQAMLERQAALLGALPAGVVVIDPAGRVREANAAAERLIGSPLAGKSWLEASASLAAADSEFEWITAGTAPRRIGLEEQILGTLGERIVLMHDVTEAHAARLGLERNARLAAMGEMVSRFAHQLRTPLAAAMLYASQLERGIPSGREREKAGERIVSRLRSLERVTREMLRFVRGERAPDQAIDVGDLLTDAADVMQPLMAERGIAFVCQDHSAGAIVHGDRRGLAAALLSLLENAAQATAQGGKIRIEAMANSRRVRIRVSDSGSGIPAHVLPRLFEAFYSTRADGTGLGLAIVKSVAQAHGGSIEVSSAEAAGTCFTLTLPRAGQSSHAANAAPAYDESRAIHPAAAMLNEREAA